MKDHNYITIQGWMVNRLKLSGNELLAYAIIYGFSHDGKSQFMGSGQYLADALGVSRRSIVTILTKLADRGFIKKSRNPRNGTGHIGYKAVKWCEETSQGCEETSQGCEETSQGDVKKLHRGCEETSHNITSYNLDHKEFNTPENPPDSADPKSFPTAVAVAHEEPGETDLFTFGEITEPQIVSETALVPTRSRSPPAKSRKTDLTPEQLGLFHAAKACFEANEKTRAIMYQDRESTARYMKHLKTLAVRCANMVPDAPADFLRNILEHFSVMCGNGKFRDKVNFTPQSLITGWVWEKVVDSLPEAEDPEVQEIIRGLFK